MRADVADALAARGQLAAAAALYERQVRRFISCRLSSVDLSFVGGNVEPSFLLPATACLLLSGATSPAQRALLMCMAALWETGPVAVHSIHRARALCAPQASLLLKEGWAPLAAVVLLKLAACQQVPNPEHPSLASSLMQLRHSCSHTFDFLGTAAQVVAPPTWRPPNPLACPGAALKLPKWRPANPTGARRPAGNAALTSRSWIFPCSFATP